MQAAILFLKKRSTANPRSICHTIDYRHTDKSLGFVATACREMDKQTNRQMDRCYQTYYLPVMSSIKTGLTRNLKLILQSVILRDNCNFFPVYTHTLKSNWISMYFPNLLELSFLFVFAFPNACRNYADY